MWSLLNSYINKKDQQGMPGVAENSKTCNNSNNLQHVCSNIPEILKYL